jgi:hypothetical protein
MPRPQKLNPTVLEAALAGLQAQRGRVVEHIAEVKRLLDHGGRQAVATPVASTARPKRPRLSAAARKRIAEAQRKRWEAIRKASGKVPAEQKAAAPRSKRKMSAAARKRIGDAARKRWAEFRKNQK